MAKALEGEIVVDIAAAPVDTLFKTLILVAP